MQMMEFTILSLLKKWWNSLIRKRDLYPIQFVIALHFKAKNLACCGSKNKQDANVVVHDANDGAYFGIGNKIVKIAHSKKWSLPEIIGHFMEKT